MARDTAVRAATAVLLSEQDIRSPQGAPVPTHERPQPQSRRDDETDEPVGPSPDAAERKEALDDDVDAIPSMRSTTSWKRMPRSSSEASSRRAGSDTVTSSGLPAAYLQPSGSSFAAFLTDQAPELLTPVIHGKDAGQLAPHGTTIVAVTFADGVVIAGDRRATMGNVIASRDIEKVFAADDHTGVGIAGTAGIAVEMVRLYQVELEHYEKIEGTQLSMEGKANRLATMLRGNLGMALQGLAAVPLLAGYDLAKGRVGSSPTTSPAAGTRSTSITRSAPDRSARGSIKKLYDPGHDRGDAIAVVLQALYDAADDDSATGGPLI